MGGALYGLVRLTFNTLYPGYKSFKAVKSKNVQDYVRWMMYWIVFAFFTAVETLLDPFLLFWFPFYSEIKIVLLLYLVSPVTKGSGVIYRRFLHPLLCQREEDIDAVLLRVKEQGYNTLSSYTTRGLTWLASTILTTAIQGGGTVLNKIKRSYSLLELTDLAELAFRDDHRFQDVTEEMNSEMRNSPAARSGIQRRQLQRRDQFQNSNLRIDRIGSTESLSSGYCSDSFLPVQAETMDTQDYELWERQQTRFTPRNTRRGLPSRREVLSDEDDYAYESIHITTPFGRVNRIVSRNTDPGMQSPDVCSSYYPSDKESDEDDLPARIVNNQQTVTSVDRHLELSRGFSRNGGKKEQVFEETADSSQTKDTITVEELQKLARRLNCELVTNPTGQEETSPPRPAPPKRFIKSDLNFEEKDGEEKGLDNCINPSVDLHNLTSVSSHSTPIQSNTNIDTEDCNEKQIAPLEELSDSEYFEPEPEPSTDEKPQCKFNPDYELISEHDSQLSALENKSNEEIKDTRTYFEPDPESWGTSNPFMDDLSTTDADNFFKHQKTDLIKKTELSDSKIEDLTAKDSLINEELKTDFREGSEDESVVSGIETDKSKLRKNNTVEDFETEADKSELKQRKKSRAPPPPSRLNLSTDQADSSIDTEHELSKEPEKVDSFFPTSLNISEDRPTEDGHIFYRSPGFDESLILSSPSSYPSVTPEIRLQRSLSPLLQQSSQLIKEKPVPFQHPTKVLTHSQGISRLRTYSNEDDSNDPTEGGNTTEHLEPSSLSKCPHCTIHSWLPHSPSCPKLKKK